MDYVTNSDALRAIVRVIERDTIPIVTEPYVVGQLWAAAGILANLAGELERMGIEGERDGVLAAGDTGTPTPTDAGWATRADEVLADLTRVIGNHSSLHYRRAIAGFDN